MLWEGPCRDLSCFVPSLRTLLELRSQTFVTFGLSVNFLPKNDTLGTNVQMSR